MENNQETQVTIDQDQVQDKGQEIINDNTGSSGVETKEKTFTQDELEKIIEKRLAREKKNLAEKIEAERQEAEKLAKMSERERQQALLDKREKTLAEREAALERANLLNETTKQLSSKNLPIEFADYLMANDAETTFNRIGEFENKWNVALEAAVSERLKGKTPVTINTGNTSGSLTVEDIKSMSAAEIQARWKEVQAALKRNK